jgi:PAS domain S-box-containing protein
MTARKRPSSLKALTEPADHERAGLRHDLEVHQEELRAQNQKLVDTLHELEEIRDRYVELYDAAPSGYCTLDAEGLIVEMNLAGAELLGRPRAGLIGGPLLPLAVSADRQRFFGYLRNAAKTTGDNVRGEELRFKTPRGERLVRLTCRVRRQWNGDVKEYLLGLEDVTERRRLEGAREEAQRAHADLVRRMLTVQEAERRRIAQDIHDDLGQQMTALRLRLEWLASVLAPHGDLRGALAPVQESAKKVDQHIDFLLRDLRPAGLEELGLVTVLRQTVADWSATFGVEASYRTSGLEDTRFAREVETQIFRIVQEALNNVHKHAAATAVDVVLERSRQGPTVLRVEDNGVGVLQSSATPAPGGERRGLGLLGMRERATLIGGTLDISSVPGHGTKVTLLLP